MPVMTHLGPAAACGFEMSRRAAWGAEWRGNLFACHFNLRKVTRHVLRPDGATYLTTDSDLLASDQTDFHPTDVVEDERKAGSLLIADTGGWYKICCPTSQLVKPQVLGAIYRVRKTGAPVPPIEAKGVASPPAGLGESALPALAKALADSASPLSVRSSCLWTLTRMPGEAARAAVRSGLAQKDPELRTAAALSAALWRDKGATDALIPLLADAERGKKLFLDAKSTCITCHAQGGVGGTYGPDLTKIGAIRTPRDLLEAIVFPSASFVRSYEPVLVKTKSASTLGILKKDAPDEVVISPWPGVDIPFPRASAWKVTSARASNLGRRPPARQP